jgi:hypothetical protein
MNGSARAHVYEGEDEVSENQQPTFWTTGWLPNGCKVSFTIPVTMLDAYETALAFTDALLKKGFRQSEPNLNEGEHEYTVTHVARRSQKSKKDNSVTPLIDFYHDGLNFSALKTWLNTPEQIADFERASGVKLANLKPFPGTAAIKRGESDDADAYVIQLQRPVKVIWKLNPDYEEGSTTQSKREFVRFGDSAPAGQQQDEPQSSEPPLRLEGEPEVREVTCAIVEIVEAEGADGKPVKRVIYRCADNIFAETTTLKHLADAGYSVKGWGKVGTYTVQPTAIVSVEGFGNSWTVTGVRSALSKAS